MQIKGSCACGSVSFSIDEQPAAMGRCHCSRCRKLGTSTMVFVKRAQFRLESGAQDIETIAPNAPYTYTRSFCRNCGTGLGEPLSPDESFPINAHCLDDNPGIRITFDEFENDRPEWDVFPEASAGERDGSATGMEAGQ